MGVLHMAEAADVFRQRGQREFLRQIQEEENITRNSETQTGDQKPSSSFDDLEGKVRKSH